MNNKTVYIVTGGSSGIGKELVLELAKDKDNLIIAVARSFKSANDFGKINITTLAYDLSRVEAIKSFVQEVGKIAAHVDVLFNNAGYLVNKPISKITETDFDLSIAVNYKAPLFLVQALLPLLRKSTKAHVLNIGSVGGVPNSDKFPGLSIYSSSKGALHILTEMLAVELAEDGIAVNCAALGSVQTEMLNKAFPGYKAQSTPDQIAIQLAYMAKHYVGLVSGKVIQFGKVGV